MSLSLSCLNVSHLILILDIHRWCHVLWFKLRTRFFVGFLADDHRDDGPLYDHPRISLKKKSDQLYLPFPAPALSQLMTVPPYAVAGLILMIASYISDRIQSRGLMVVCGCTLGGIGYMSVFHSIRFYRFSPIPMQSGFFWVSRRHTFIFATLPRFALPQAHMPAWVLFLHGVRTALYLYKKGGEGNITDPILFLFPCPPSHA